MTRFTQDLNSQQARAVSTLEGPLLIIAGAGSGKTRVITYRIAHMLETGIPQSSILALTFTNKAAREMEQRVRALTGKKLAKLTVSTFHAFGVQVLRREIRRLGFRENFSIYDTADQLSAIKESAREISFNLDNENIKSIQTLFSALKTGRRDFDPEAARYHELYREYGERLKLHNAVDFDDLIVLPVKIFSEHPDALAHYHGRFQYFLVDEFQDTSVAQYRFIHMLAKDSRNICIVGDDDQSIYSWRGAHYENLLQFERDFSDVIEIKLEQNYRSTDTILEAANQLIANNQNRKGKALWSQLIGGNPIELYYADDGRDEAAFIAREVKAIAGLHGYRYDEFAILVRTNSLSRRLEEAFLAENLPYRISGGSSFFDRKEIKDLVAYLRVMANQEDDVAVLRIINTPRRGIGKKTLEQIDRYASTHRCSVHQAVQSLIRATDSPLSDRAQADLEGFLELIDEYRERLLGGKNMAKTLMDLIGAIDYWGFLVGEHQSDERLAKWKYRNLETLSDIMNDFEHDPDVMDHNLFTFLSRITLSGRDNDDEPGKRGEVNLMTIHAAKGLEFRIVFVAGAEDRFLPHARAVEENPANLEEERRLFYVAITRAMEKLYITSARRRTIMRELVECSPSPFLEEIPSELLSLHEPEEVAAEDDAARFFSQMPWKK
jgi:DNA helicase-2/ATP-dependent DNA helicase PcrA